jgi:hypothetical protein
MAEKVAISRWSTLQKVVRTLFAIVALLTGALCLIKLFTNTAKFVAGDQSSIYWLVVADPNDLFILGAVCCVAIWIALLLVNNIGWTERIAITVLMLLFGCGLLTLMGPHIGPIYTHRDSMGTPSAQYHTGDQIAWAGSCPPIGTDCDERYLYTHIVFRCDPFGFVCRAIYHGEEQMISGEREDIPTGTFVANDSTISLLVDGEVVWEYPLEPGSD